MIIDDDETNNNKIKFININNKIHSFLLLFLPLLLFDDDYDDTLPELWTCDIRTGSMF